MIKNIGNITIGEWQNHKYYGYILPVNSKNIHGYICIHPSNMDGKYYLSFNDMTLREIYLNIIQNKFPVVFDSVEDGQKYVECFLEKFSKLLAFF